MPLYFPATGWYNHQMIEALNQIRKEIAENTHQRLFARGCKVYLVGGAVRDQALGHPIHDRDYVVTGATLELMLELGFKQVGSHFPVFLHEDTGEEYALARLEKKVAPGYLGFETMFDANVTIVDDLLRRDLTINAMAINLEVGTIIDPFGGLQDLKDGVLRHVSSAFAEDPLRVLRVARFAARYNFAVWPNTKLLMEQLVRDGELNNLSRDRVWAEMERGLMEKLPARFIWVLASCGALDVLGPWSKVTLEDAIGLERVASKTTDIRARFLCVASGFNGDGVIDACDWRVPAALSKLNGTWEIARDMDKFESLSETDQLDILAVCKAKETDDLINLFKLMLREHCQSRASFCLFDLAVLELRKLDFASVVASAKTGPEKRQLVTEARVAALRSAKQKYTCSLE